MREGPLRPGALGLYARLGSGGGGVRSYGMKSKIRLSSSNTGLVRAGGAVVVVVVRIVGAEVVVVESLVALTGVELTISEAPFFCKSGAVALVLINPGVADWLVGVKATLLKMAPKVLSIELGRSPREKTGRSSKDRPAIGATVARRGLRRTSPASLSERAAQRVGKAVAAHSSSNNVA